MPASHGYSVLSMDRASECVCALYIYTHIAIFQWEISLKYGLWGLIAGPTEAES